MKSIRPELTVDASPPVLTKHSASKPKAMQARCTPRVLRSGALLAAGSLLALGCAAVTFEPWPEPDPANASCCGQSLRASFEPWLEPDSTVYEAMVSAATDSWQRAAVAADELDPLRTNAAMDDADSAVQLAQKLVDRFETSRSTDDLFEAVLWIDRYYGSESLARSGVMARVASKHCDQKILHFHWMCAAAE